MHYLKRIKRLAENQNEAALLKAKEVIYWQAPKEHSNPMQCDIFNANLLNTRCRAVSQGMYIACTQDNKILIDGENTSRQ